MPRGLLVQTPKAFDGFQKMVDARDVVITRFQPLFSHESVGMLDAEQFKSFLLPAQRATLDIAKVLVGWTPGEASAPG